MSIQHVMLQCLSTKSTLTETGCSLEKPNVFHRYLVTCFIGVQIELMWLSVDGSTAASADAAAVAAALLVLTTCDHVMFVRRVFPYHTDDEPFKSRQHQGKEHASGALVNVPSMKPLASRGKGATAAYRAD